MTQKEILNRIKYQEKILEDCRLITEKCNEEIIQGDLQPNNLQSAELDSIAAKGRAVIAEIERLNKLLNR
ncbi:hypothetical protein [Anaerophaga thermohalophila]|jgi:hypothetical protein|uniref:hypothetical protein n=1 Tax=Anaerophaga thermohalophila TaxID=177400 RepID=UPI000237D239|nr:hypothetical protein [Anaerophaga thermohalophila]